MKFVLPVCDKDLHQAVRLARWIKHLGGESKWLIAASQRAWWDIEKVSRPLSAEVYRLPTENEEGWPESPNHMFYSVVTDVEFTESWYWFEADNIPLFKGWEKSLQSEYDSEQKPYMGVVNDTKYINKKTGEKITRGKHMVGTGIYPADFAARCRSVHYMDRRPFDICIEEEVVPECHNTNQIAHRWGTINYHYNEHNVIIMDDREPGYDYAAPIPPWAVVVHGCKDESLFNLLDPRGITG